MYYEYLRISLYNICFIHIKELVESSVIWFKLGMLIKTVFSALLAEKPQQDRFFLVVHYLEVDV